LGHFQRKAQLCARKFVTFSVVYMRIFRYTKGKTNLPVQAGVPLYTRFDGFLTKTIREKELSTHESIYG
jgi:hypothetical protein